MKKFLDFLNGKKTAIGASILSLIVMAQMVGIKIPNVDSDKVAGAIDAFIKCLGVIIAVVGVIHKLWKGWQTKKTAGMVTK